MCSKGFCFVHGISMEKLYSAARLDAEETCISTANCMQAINHDNKKEGIKSFLQGIWDDDSYSECDPINPLLRRLSSFQLPKDLHLLYCELLIECNEGNKIPTLTYFNKIWKEHFPHLGAFF